MFTVRGDIQKMSKIQRSDYLSKNDLLLGWVKKWLFLFVLDSCWSKVCLFQMPQSQEIQECRKDGDNRSKDLILERHSPFSIAPTNGVEKERTGGFQIPGMSLLKLDGWQCRSKIHAARIEAGAVDFWKDGQCDGWCIGSVRII